MWNPLGCYSSTFKKLGRRVNTDQIINVCPLPVNTLYTITFLTPKEWKIDTNKRQCATVIGGRRLIWERPSGWVTLRPVPRLNFGSNSINRLQKPTECFGNMAELSRLLAVPQAEDDERMKRWHQWRREIKTRPNVWNCWRFPAGFPQWRERGNKCVRKESTLKATIENVFHKYSLT